MVGIAVLFYQADRGAYIMRYADKGTYLLLYPVFIGFMPPILHNNSVRSVNYMDLSSGTYTFRLRAFDKYTGQQIGERSQKAI